MLRFCPILWLVLLILAAPAAAEVLVPTRIANDVYAIVGTGGEAAPDNRGRTGNSGFIVGPEGVVVIDTGVSHAHGKALLEAIRTVTAKPVVLVVLTHAVQEFLFGTTAFTAEGAAVVAHEQSESLMRARCQHCLENLRQILGEDAMAGTRLVMPDWTVAGSVAIDAGGRRLELWHPGWAATPGDLMVFEPDSKVLFAGGVAVHRQIPLLRDGKLSHWAGTLDDLATRGLAWIVPGHGVPMRPAQLAEQRSYLTGLDARVRELYTAMASLMEAVEQGGLPLFGGWAAYDPVHRKNVHQRYLELEVDELSR